MTAPQSWYRLDGKDLLLFIKVQPRSGKDGFAEILGDCRKLRIKAPPVDGKANAHLVRYLAKLLGVRRSDIVIESGQNNRNKCIRIKGLPELPDSLT